MTQSKRHITMLAVKAAAYGVLSLLRRRRRLVATLAMVLTTLVTLANLATVNAAVDVLGRGKIADANRAYLTSLEQRTARVFVTLSALRGGLATLESSSAGVSFFVDADVQFGAGVRPIYDLVTHAWRACLVGLAGVTATDVTLKLAELVSAPSLALLALALAAYGLVRVWALRGGAVLGRLCHVLVLWTVLVHAIAPLAIFATANVSALVTGPLLAQSHDAFIEAHNHYAPGEHKDIEPHIRHVIKQYREQAVPSQLRDRAHDLVTHVATHTCALVIECFVFPLVFAWAALHAVRRLSATAFAPVKPLAAASMEASP